MSSDTQKSFLGQITEGNIKGIPKDNCFRQKNMICLENKFLTRAGYKKYNSIPYSEHINLIYEFKRIVGGNLKIIGFGTNLATGSPTYSSAPSSNAGADQSKDTSDTVTLDGSASANAVSYLWTQTSGTTVTLSDATAQKPTFTMPSEDVTFQLKVINFWGNDTDTVTINVISNWITLSGFNYPSGIYYDSVSEFIYISDYSNNRIVKTKIDGTGRINYGSLGNGVGQFYHPVGIFYDSSTELIYIGDSANNRIVKTKIDGTGWTTLSGFNSPHGVHYDSASGYIYVANHSSDNIVKTKIDGTGWITLGNEGSGEGQFSALIGIYYDSASEFIYVADGANHRIVKTKIDGTGWITLGNEGSGEGQFSAVADIFYDSSTELIYAADRNNHRIVKTKIDGSNWEIYGNSGSGEGEFSGLFGIHYDSINEYHYIADSNNNRIVKCKPIWS